MSQFLKTPSGLRYGLILLASLAYSHRNKKPVSLEKISQTAGVSLKYLEQIAALLKENKVIDSVRGVKGGYFLKKAPQDIDLSQLVQILAGPILSGAQCSCSSHACNVKGGCPSQNFHHLLQKSVGDLLKRIKLSRII